MSVRQNLFSGRVSSKLFSITFVCFLPCWLGLHDLQGQQIIVREGGQKEKLALYKQLNNFLEGKCNAAKNRIASHLLDIDRVCELSPKQRTHLEVAGKGAVISYSNRIGDKLELSAKRSGIEFKRGNPPEEDPDKEQDGNNLVRRGARVFDLGLGRNDAPEMTVDKEQIWIDSVKKTLTEAQAEKLKSWVVARDKMIRKAAVDHLVAKANLKMFMSLEQSQKLEAYLDREYGPQLVRQLKLPPKQNGNFIVAGVPQPNRDVKVDDSLMEFLSEPQLEIWKTNFQNDLDSLVE